MKLLVAVLSLVLSSSAAAQCPAPASVPGGVSGFVTLGSAAEDRLNLTRLLGCPAPSTLIRSPLALSETLPAGGARGSFAVVYPSVAGSWNSRIPLSLNDGARWAGRGASATLSGGVRFRWRFLHATIVPEIVAVENRQFLVIPSASDSLSPFANPWHGFGYTIDAPLRFGARPFTVLGPGQSSVEARFGVIAAGFSTENMWWGSGVRTGIVMSNNAAGIPQAYVRSARPIRTPVGTWELRGLLGTLTESRFFDRNTANDLRAFSGAVATVRPWFDSTFVLGASRVLFSTLESTRDLPSHATDFALTLSSKGNDELTALFGEWAFPESGLALHWEWARLRLPSLRELVVAPQRTQGFTIGAKWATAVYDTRTFVRVRAEATMLEQNIPPERIQTLTFYPSRRVPQGYTQRGEVIGAATGPGSSSQWLGVDLFRPRWTVGLNGGRTRYEDEAYYFQATGNTGRSHDVALFAGMRAGAEWQRLSLHGLVQRTRRLNYLFQTSTAGFAFDNRFDVWNTTLNVELAYRP